MNIKNPIKSYLVKSAKANSKPVLIALLVFLIVGLILVIGRITPVFKSIFSEHLLRELVVDLPVKAVGLIVPIILMFKNKSHSEWHEAYPDMPMSKKNFTTAIYLEMFLSALVAVPVLVVIWVVASLVDPNIVESILTTGVFALGVMFFIPWVMTALIFTLQFTKLLEINDGAVLLFGSVLVAFWLGVGLQSLLFALVVPHALASVICAFIGLIIILIGWKITASLYEKVDL